MESKVQELLDTLLLNHGIRPEDIPDIELYMDQITTFMDDRLSGYKRYPDDKVLTKTMINNYTKNRLLPPSNKKKYSSGHLILLIMIYFYKNILSISDIQNFLSPLTGKYFPEDPESGLSMKDIYSKLEDQLEGSKLVAAEEIMQSFEKSSSMFQSESLNPDQADSLTAFTFISQLCYDIYIRKYLIEKLLDQMYPPEPKRKKREK